MTKLLNTVKSSGEDYEWYPTTNEIIESLYWDIKSQNLSYDKKYESSYISLLDIGCGDGKIFREMEKISKENPDDDENRNYTTLNFKNKFAIEKSQVLINSLPSDIFVLGTDFHEQTLIDKEVDVIFSNPPYSEFSQWTTKIIKEANAPLIYVVIPQRWENEKSIKDALELRGGEITIVGEFDFLNSEDRKARAKVHLLRIEFKTKHYNSSTLEDDPFDIWFDEVFKVNAQKVESSTYEYTEKYKKAERLKELVTGESLIPRLEVLYCKELEHLISNYSKVAELDSDLLKELNVSIEGLKKALKLKISGLKNLYWRELFDNLSEITDRLTSKSREKLLKKLTDRTSIDFTKSNAYSVVIWAIKNANEYFDKQLLEIYEYLTTQESIRLYKSNTRIVKDSWRYIKDDMSHYSLDYRIVKQSYSTLEFDYSGNFKGISYNAAIQIADIFTVAKNLGFDVHCTAVSNRNWFPGKKEYFNYTQSGEAKEFAEMKAFKNGNLHFKFSQEFMKALNIEAARLNRWIKSSKEASEEFGISEEKARKLFENNFSLATTKISDLLPETQESIISTDKVDTVVLVEETENNPKIITVSNMIEEFAKKILEHHRTGDFYGGVEHSYYCEYNKRMETSTSYIGAFQLFEINNDYKNGKTFGLAVSYKRDNKNQIVSIDVNRVFQDGKVPFQKDKKVISINRDMLCEILGNYELLFTINMLEKLFKASDITNKSLKRSIVAPMTTKTEEPKNSFVAIIGKGKKAKKLSANNLFDLVADNVETTSTTSVQLAFNF